MSPGATTHPRGERVQAHRGCGVDVTQVGAHAGGGHHVIKAEGSHQRIHLQQQRQRLTDAARRACRG